jgi:sigma-54 specific flagellar transcriptional regulator A
VAPEVVRDEAVAKSSLRRLVTAADLPPRYRPADWQPDPAAEQIAAPLLAPVDAPKAELPRTELTEREALLLLEDAPPAPAGAMLPLEGLDLRAHVAAIEETLIRQALARSEGIVAQAARLLGLRRTTLVEKLRKFDISAGDDTSED